MKFRPTVLAYALSLVFSVSHADSDALKTKSSTVVKAVAAQAALEVAEEVADKIQQESKAEKAEPKKKKPWWAFWRDDEEDVLDEENKIYVPRYPVEIQLSEKIPEIDTLLDEHLPLLHYQRKEELDDEQIQYLAEDAPTDAKNLLKTEGYFDAKTELIKSGQGFILKVNLGKRTTINQLQVAIVGDILRDKEIGRYYKAAFKDWKLPVGASFRQEDWSASKVSALSAVVYKKYPLAKFTQTQATIDPNTQTADLKVLIDSNRPIYFGDFHITGNQRYPISVIQGAAPFQKGDVYDLNKLLDYQQALENNNHYSGASVQADFDGLKDDFVPIKVSVSEVKRQKVEAGLRFDSEYGMGGNISYDHYNLFNRGYTGSAVLDMDKYETTIGGGISQPRDNKGRYFTSNITYKRSTTQKLEKRSISSGLWRVHDWHDKGELRYGLEFVMENSSIPDSQIQLGKSYATMLTASWKRQNMETSLRPANGYYVNAKIGSTLGRFASSAMMARISGGAGYYFTPENEKIGTFIARGNLGYVYTNEKEANGKVPTSLMFRTGGASTVRGYELDSIGRIAPDSDAVLPDRVMAVASAEYQYPIKKDFALAVFHDMGGVSRNFQKMHWKHGSGLGVRWFSPVAPFSFDLAYGHQDKKIRWHISLGTRF